MRCETAREAISALLDDEDPGVDPARVEEHLSTCRDCRAWKQSAHEVTRRARIGAARPASSRADDVVSIVKSTTRLPARPSRLTLARLALVAVAAVQIFVAAPVLIFGRDHSAPMHVAHEMGSFDMALAIGFLAVAWKPVRARGMQWLVGATAMLLVVTAVSDLLGGRTSFGDEAPHALTVVGWLLLALVAREAPMSNVGPNRLATTIRKRRASSATPAVHPAAAERDRHIRGRGAA